MTCAVLSTTAGSVLGTVGCRGDRQQRAHRLGGGVDGDHRAAAVDRRGQVNVNRILIQVPESGTLSVTSSSSDSSSREPVDGCVAERFWLTCHLAGAADSVHRVDRGAARPHHVGGVEHDGERVR